jgi:20S proteasome subunit beta 7
MLQQPRDDIYGPYDHSYLQSNGPRTHTQSPAVTGTSVIALKFNGGVAMATDNLGAYFPEHSQVFDELS